MPRAARITLLIVLICYWLAIFVVTHLPPSDLPKVGVNDKIEHFVGYGILGGLIYLTVWAYRPKFRHAWLLVIVIAMCYGAIDEWLQLAVGRSCELADWIADVGGTVVAVLILSGIRRALWKRVIARQHDAWRTRVMLQERVGT
jgi:VanZ family protein